MRKRELLTLNKPIYVECTVFELRKLEMYKFHYDFMKKKCKKCTLLFTETDSLCYEVDEDFYEIMHQHKEFLDLSNQPKDSKYYSNDNKKVPGKMKDEYGGRLIYEFIGLKSNVYSIRDINRQEKSTDKGHNSLIKYGEFKNTHFNKEAIRHKMRGINCKKHELVSYGSNKRSLSDFDVQRYILSDGINTLPYGHEDIPKMNK